MELPRLLVTALLVLSLNGCYVLRPSSGGGQHAISYRHVRPEDVALPPGYKIEALATRLTFPTGVTFDSGGNPVVTESGYSYGEVWTVPRLIRIRPDGRQTVIATGKRNGPWNGVSFHNGAFYVAEGGELQGGRILKITENGSIHPLITGLPSRGDHHTNGPVIGPDGWIYFGQGTATNSGIVGEDDFRFGWLRRFPRFHDIPGQDIVLRGENYVSKDVLHGRGQAVTGAFVPFGTATYPGQVIHGAVPCSGSVLKIPPGGGRPRLVAWGLRNPYGLSFSPEGNLYVTDNAYDDRGSRPIWGTGDQLWKVYPGVWYGWPDYSAGMSVAQNHFTSPGKARPRPLLAVLPNQPPKPSAVFGVHSSANGLDFSRNPRFGHRGEAFVALFGDQAPQTGKVLAPVGFKVVRVNVDTGEIEDFAVNRGHRNGPASALGAGGLERPLAARFNPNGSALYIVDFGELAMDRQGSHPVKNTGVLWRVTRL